MGGIPIDTTGLPPGATFGAMTGVGTVAAPGATIEVAVTVEAARVAGSKVDGPLKVGQAFGPRYHIIQLLGAGGMGAVYQAWDAELSVAVALKVIRTDAHAGRASDAEKRLKQELILARQVTHKHVVRIHDIGELDGIKYITMPYVQGNDLATELRRSGKLPVARALRFARQIAAGLQAAHEAGVIHRDLKPANIMISGTGDDMQALIMDFGISASMDQATTGSVLGTLEYMAPEQARGGAVDGRADIYAFGLILYEMLTGPRLVAAATPQARVDAMKQRFEEGLVPIRELDSSIPEPLQAFVTRSVDKDAASRFQNVTELVSALARLDDTGNLVPFAARLTKPMIAAAAAMVLLLLGGTYLGTRRLVTPPKAHDPVSVLIADFENRSGDPIFDGVLEQSLGIALERASYINVFKAGDRHALAAQVTNGKSSRLTEEVGQLIARREGIRVLVAGGIERQQRGYRLELRALDPANVTKPITTVRQTLTDESQVLNDITGVADRIREALGESKTEMAKLADAETVTAASLDAMSAYARAQELQTAGKYKEALPDYQRAVELDPTFGRAYAGIAGVYANYFKQRDKAEASFQMALKHLDRMTEREKYRTLGKYYLDVAGNYEKAIETYETLVQRYPADDSGHGGLALAYVLSGDLTRALPHVRSALQIYPHNSLQRYNYAMYSMYAGEFGTAIEEASVVQRENPTLEYAWLPVALSKLAQGDQAGAREAYASLAAMSAFGSSLSQLGLADLDSYLGRHRDAVRALREGLSADAARKDSHAMAQKYVALAEAYLSIGDRSRAIDASHQAVKLTDRESVLYPAARVLLLAGRHDEAAQVADALEQKLQRHTTAYAGLIRGESALQRGRLAEAIEAIINAQKRRDSWFSRYLLGKAYVTAGSSHAAEALAELDRSVKRCGEASDAFTDDMPTLRYLPPAYYWLGRAQEGVGSTAEANKSYEQFLALRADADSQDPLAVDARRRVSPR
jgi:tetratricopeptide (TPR) repeat protein